MANNPISFVDPDGGRSVENDQTKAAREKARREFKEWWADNAKYFRHRGGDANGGNLVYHLNNLAVFGTSDFERMDLNKRGIDGSIWSQAGWASVIKEVFGIRESDASDQAYGAAVCEAAMREAEAELAQWAFNNQIERLMHGFKHEEYEREAQQQKREDRKKARKEKRKGHKKDAKDGIEKENPLPGDDVYVYGGKEPLIYSPSPPESLAGKVIAHPQFLNLPQDADGTVVTDWYANAGPGGGGPRWPGGVTSVPEWIGAGPDVTVLRWNTDGYALIRIDDLNAYQDVTGEAEREFNRVLNGQPQLDNTRIYVRWPRIPSVVNPGGFNDERGLWLYGIIPTPGP